MVTPKHALGPNDSEIEGDASAPVLVQEYADFQCPSCKAFHDRVGSTVDDLVQAEEDPVRVHLLPVPRRRVGARRRGRGAAPATRTSSSSTRTCSTRTSTPRTPASSPRTSSSSSAGTPGSPGAAFDTFEKCVRGEPYEGFVRQSAENASKRGVNRHPDDLHDRARTARPSSCRPSRRSTPGGVRAGGRRHRGREDLTAAVDVPADAAWSEPTARFTAMLALARSRSPARRGRVPHRRARAPRAEPRRVARPPRRDRRPVRRRTRTAGRARRGAVRDRRLRRQHRRLLRPAQLAARRRHRPPPRASRSRLSILMIEVGRRIGLALHGVGMPGHFLVGVDDEPDVFVDPFHAGRVLDVDGCREVFAALQGPDAPFSPALPRADRPAGDPAARAEQPAARPTSSADAVDAVWVARLRLRVRRALRSPSGGRPRRCSARSVGSREAAAALEALAERLDGPDADEGRGRGAGAARPGELSAVAAPDACRCSRSARCCSRTRALPLHVFEPRYRALVEHCLAARRPEFGVVLIERGSEVGGGDTRFDVGTVARIVEASQFPDGRYALVTVGTAAPAGARVAARRPVPAGRRSRSSTSAGRRGGRRPRPRDAVEQRLRRVLALATRARRVGRAGRRPPRRRPGARRRSRRARSRRSGRSTRSGSSRSTTPASGWSGSTRSSSTSPSCSSSASARADRDDLGA